MVKRDKSCSILMIYRTCQKVESLQILIYRKITSHMSSLDLRIVEVLRQSPRTNVFHNVERREYSSASSNKFSSKFFCSQPSLSINLESLFSSTSLGFFSIFTSLPGTIAVLNRSNEIQQEKENEKKKNILYFIILFPLFYFEIF